jgi:hypothetical protein
MSKLTEILSHLKEPVKFDTPVIIKATPHSFAVYVYSLEKTDEGEVMVQINDGSFHKLEEKDRNYDMVANSLLQRLKILNHERNN